MVRNGPYQVSVAQDDYLRRSMWYPCSLCNVPGKFPLLR